MTADAPTIAIDLDELQRALDYIRAANSVPLQRVLWRRHGQPVVPSADDLSEWSYIGLSNVEFARTHFLPPPPDIEENT